ncbi:16S rRNA methyltransferase, partial [Pseudomonas aeruginosa]
DYLLASLAARMTGGENFLVGEKRGGNERASKQLAANCKPRKLDSARHCQLWQVRIEQAPAEPDQHALAQRYSLPLA